MNFKTRMMEAYPSEKFTKAKKRVDRIKDFYGHLSVYVIANVLLFVFKGYTFNYMALQGIGNQDFLDWVTLNIILTPVVWGLGLIIHGLLAFRSAPLSIKNLKPKFIRDWEERQIQKYMNAEDE